MMVGDDDDDVADADADADARDRRRGDPFDETIIRASLSRGAMVTSAVMTTTMTTRARASHHRATIKTRGRRPSRTSAVVVGRGARATVMASRFIDIAEDVVESVVEKGAAVVSADVVESAEAVGDSAVDAPATMSASAGGVPQVDPMKAFADARNSFNASTQAFNGSIKGAEDSFLRFENGVVGEYTQGVDNAFASFKGALPEEFAKLVDLAKDDGDVAIALGVAAVFLPVILGGVAEGVRGYAGSKRPAYVNEQLEKDSRAFLIDTRSSERRRADGVPDLRKDARDRGAAFEVDQFDPVTRAATANPRAAELRITAERVIKRTKWGGRLYFMGPDAAALAKQVTALANRKCFTIAGDFDAWRSQGLKIRRNGSYDKNIIDRVGEDAGDFVTSGSQYVQTQIGTARTTISSKVAKANAQQKAAAVVGFLALAYALSQYEKTLAFIGFLGIFWSIYDRVTNYESPEEFFDDAGRVLGPVTAIGSVAGSTAMKVASAAVSADDSESDSFEDLKNMELPTLADMEMPGPADGEEEEEEGEEEGEAEEDKTNTA